MQENTFSIRADPKGRDMSKLTLYVPPWWSSLQPRGDICASGVRGPDALDGPCKLHRICMSDTLAHGQKKHLAPSAIHQNNIHIFHQGSYQV